MKIITKKVKKLINDMDKILLVFSVSLFIFGLLNIVTASSRESVSLDVPLYYYFYRHLFMLIVGVVGALIIINLPINFYKKTIFFFLIVIGGFVLLTLIMSVSHRGATSWLNIGFGNFQPSELAKPILIVALGVLFERYFYNLRKKKVNNNELIAKIIIVGCTIPLLVFLQKDFGTMFIMVMTFGIMFLASPILVKEKLKSLLTLLVIGIIGIILLFIIKGSVFTETQMGRFDYLKPCQKYEHIGYQICNAYISINEGGLFGLGISKSKQKYSYIAEPHTDMVFSIIAEEYGLLKSTLIFIALLVVLYRIIVISTRANTICGRYICLGGASYIFLHIFINLGGLFGLIPLTGIPLPFLSYGGSFTIALIAMLALIQRVNIETKNQKIKISKI